MTTRMEDECVFVHEGGGWEKKKAVLSMQQGDDSNARLDLFAENNGTTASLWFSVPIHTMDVSEEAALYKSRNDVFVLKVNPNKDIGCFHLNPSTSNPLQR